MADLLPATTCSRCGHVSSPPRQHCPEGCGAGMHDHTIPNRGTVYVSTQVHVPHRDLGSGYQLAYVDLEAGPRVLARTAAPQMLPPGTPVAVEYAYPTTEGRQTRPPQVTLTVLAADRV